MDRLREIWNKESFVESAWSTANRSNLVLNLYVISLHALFLSLKHPGLILQLLLHHNLPRMIFNDFIDYAFKIQLRFQPQASLDTQLITLHFTPDLFNLSEWVKTDNIFHEWFVNLLYNCGRIHHMNPIHRAHVIQKSYVLPEQFNEYMNVCKYCIESMVERNGRRYRFKALHHLCDQSDRYPTRMFQRQDVWCQLCKVVPLIQIMRSEQCIQAYGLYTHKCRCYNEVFCIHCNEGIRNCWVRYEDRDVYVDIDSALRFKRPNLARRRLFRNGVVIDHPRPAQLGVHYVSDESLDSLDDVDDF